MTLSSKYWGFMFWSLIVSYDHRDADSRIRRHCCYISSQCGNFLPLQRKWLMRELRALYHCIHFLFFSFGSWTSKARACTSKCIYSDRKQLCMSRKRAKIQKKPEKNLSLNLRRILGTATEYKSKQNKTTTTTTITIYHCKLFRRKSCLLCHGLWAQLEILGLVLDWPLWRKNKMDEERFREDHTGNCYNFRNESACLFWT